MKVFIILLLLLIGEIAIIGLLAYNKPLKLPPSIYDQIKTIYYQETPRADTNLISNICVIYQQYSEIVNYEKALYISHCYIMKLESDIINIQKVNSTGDIGISQINTNTWAICKNQFIADLLEKSKQRNNYKLILSLINESDNIGNIKLNICFSLWYLKLLNDESKNIQEVISKYNCGRAGKFESLPKITQRYINNYDNLEKKYNSFSSNEIKK